MPDIDHRPLRVRTARRYALSPADGVYLTSDGHTTTDPRAARSSPHAYVIEAAVAGLPGYRVVRVSVGDYRCFDCGGYGEHSTRPDDAVRCHHCGGHGWIPRRGGDR